MRFGPSQYPTFKIGDKVKVSKGLFKGKEGVIRLPITVEGACEIIIDEMWVWVPEEDLELINEKPMRGTSELKCIVPSCENQATETQDINGKPAVIFCICHKLNHVLKVKEYSNAYSLIECETSTCSYEERVEVAVGCREVKL